MRKNTNILFAPVRIGSCLALACLALWQAPYAQAQLLVYEGYDYDASTSFPDPVDGSLNGGIGWDGGWTTTQFLEGEPDPLPNPEQRIADGLNYTDSNGNRLETSGRAHDIYGQWWNLDIGNPLREFDTSPTGPAGVAGLLNPNGSLGKIGTTLWMSILLEGRDETGNHAGSFFEFTDVNSLGRNLHVGRPFNMLLDGTVVTPGPNEAYGIMRKTDSVIRLNGQPEYQYVGTGVDAGSGAGNAEKVFMVLKLDFNGQFDEIAEVEFGLDPGDYGTNISGWINPDLDTEPQVGVGSFADEVNFWQMAFTRINVHGDADLVFDEFRIGATYADVAPIAAGIDGDFDSDGDVDGADFLLWQRDMTVGSLADWEANFGTTAGGAVTAAVPEPSAMVLLGIALAGFAVRRRASDLWTFQTK